ncbi:MAG: hypothetical protein RBT15_08685, partial [Gudongella sp.]|nr:hypothetical protein [Gudongella sp.]
MEAEGRILELSDANLQSFKNFCVKYRNMVDDTFLDDEDLDSIVPGPENPTFLYLEGSKIVAVASLMMDEYNIRENRSRFRILFSEKESRGIYEGIFHRILIHAQDLEKVYIKVPTFNDILMDRIERLGFI